MNNVFITVQHDADLKKRTYWKRIQDQRNQYETRMHLYLRGVLNKQYKEMASRIDSTNYRSDQLAEFITKEPVDKAFRYLYMTVGVAFAEDVFRSHKSERTGMLFKAEDEPIDVWYESLQNYVTTRAGKKITSITGQSKEFALRIIRMILEQSNADGWGADQTAREMRKALIKEGQAINQWRALRIARTEIVSASNMGSQMGKYWIPTYDSRTRDTHLAVDGQNPKEMDEDFNVGGYPAEYPGDDRLPPEEVINCRCAIAHGVKGF
jgi:hypothetical protein